MGHSDHLPTMLLLMVLLATTLAFVSFGLATVNLAEALPVGDATPDSMRRAAERAEGERASIDVVVASLTARLDDLRRTGEQVRSAGVSRLGDAATTTAELRARVTEREAEVARLGTRLAEATSVDVASIYGFGAPSGDPLWVECLSDGVVLQPSGARIPTADLERGASAFVEAARDRGYVVLLVRPGGFESFVQARKLAEENGVDVGYEPVEEHLTLRYGGAP